MTAYMYLKKTPFKLDIIMQVMHRENQQHSTSTKPVNQHITRSIYTIKGWFYPYVLVN